MSSSPTLPRAGRPPPADPRPRRAVATAALFARLLRAEWAHHPWRQAAAVVAVGLGVALAFAVQLINASALAEFDAAVHAASGAPDFSVRARDGALPEDLYPRVAQAPGVALASPVVEVAVTLQGADGRPHPAQLLGLDALVAPWVSPDWLPMPDVPTPAAAADAASAAGTEPSGTRATRSFPPASAPSTAAPPDAGPMRLVALDPDLVFANAAARALIGDARAVALRAGGRTERLAVAGRIAATGPPLLVMDIAGAQARFGRLGTLSRVDVRLRPGARAEAVMAALDAGPGVRAAAPDEDALRAARLSRSYRVNLSVLSLVALFTGGFLVFSVQSLAVAKRIPQLALLGVLGMDGRGRRALVQADSLLVGLVGAALGLALGTGLAVAALRALGGDLGSGTFAGEAPPLQWSPLAALAYAALGVASALAGGWWPARAAQRIAPAQSLKGLGGGGESPWPAAAGLGLVVLAAALAFVPPWNAIPWGAYACVGVLLLGGISLVPQAVALLLRGLRGMRQPVAALAVARAIDQRQTASAAVAGVVASLSLVVALTVMVTSFRQSLIAWLDDVLPADLYVRPAGGTAAGPPASLDDAVVAAARRALAPGDASPGSLPRDGTSIPSSGPATSPASGMPSAPAPLAAPASLPAPASLTAAASLAAPASLAIRAPLAAPARVAAPASLAAVASPTASASWAARASPAGATAAPAGPAATTPAAAPAGIARLRAERLVPILLAPDQPQAVLIARDAPHAGEPPDVPWVEPPAATRTAPDRPGGPVPPSGDDAPVPVYASEVLAALQHLRVGDTLTLPLPAAAAGTSTDAPPPPPTARDSSAAQPGASTARASLDAGSRAPSARAVSGTAPRAPTDRVSADAPPDSPIIQAGSGTGPRRPAGRASADVEPGSTIVQAPSPAGGGMRRRRASADAHARSSTFEAAVGTGPGAPAVRRSADTRSGTSAAAPAGPTAGPAVRAVVRGIWRDYARQQGALLMDRADWLRLTGDARVSGLAVWLAPGSSAAGVAAALARAAPADAPVEIATSGQLRATSLRIFDRSFAVTRWLQGVALAIGLAGIAASFSAQVLARRREFGTLQHLGFTRRQVLSLVALEGALWSAVGAVLGVVLGLAVSVVLVKIVNPQSFHWTMQMSVPTPTLAALWLGVVAAGALTAWGSGHAAAGRDMVRAVKEDW